MLFQRIPLTLGLGSHKKIKNKKKKNKNGKVRGIVCSFVSDVEHVQYSFLSSPGLTTIPSIISICSPSLIHIFVHVLTI